MWARLLPGLCVTAFGHFSPSPGGMFLTTTTLLRIWRTGTFSGLLKLDHFLMQCMSQYVFGSSKHLHCLTTYLVQGSFYRSRGQGSIPGGEAVGLERGSLSLVVGLERGSLSLVSTSDELLGRKSSGSGLESRDYRRRGSAALTTRNPSIRKRWH
jgi:hypothetical protein